MKLKMLAVSVSLSAAAMGVSAENNAGNSGEYIAFFDHSLPIEKRLDDISARLTDREKGNMITLWNEGVPRYGLKSFMPGEAYTALRHLVVMRRPFSLSQLVWQLLGLLRR